MDSNQLKSSNISDILGLLDKLVEQNVNTDVASFSSNNDGDNGSTPLVKNTPSIINNIFNINSDSISTNENNHAYNRNNSNYSAENKAYISTEVLPSSQENETKYEYNRTNHIHKNDISMLGLPRVATNNKDMCIFTVTDFDNMQKQNGNIIQSLDIQPQESLKFNFDKNEKAILAPQTLKQATTANHNELEEYRRVYAELKRTNSSQHEYINNGEEKTVTNNDVYKKPRHIKEDTIDFAKQKQSNNPDNQFKHIEYDDSNFSNIEDITPDVLIKIARMMRSPSFVRQLREMWNTQVQLENQLYASRVNFIKSDQSLSISKNVSKHIKDPTGRHKSVTQLDKEISQKLKDLAMQQQKILSEADVPLFRVTHDTRLIRIQKKIVGILLEMIL
ncbi:hypothetical protein BB561_001320 [Smittium simulii]|uniref:Uncharacterized protein n=1 Tax=Smittium simulii TaxID=133385 RepID=A0A2T9YV21_9FUNG|nr:hypothetical protein BB561_001320 [Smittium simulii]